MDFIFLRFPLTKEVTKLHITIKIHDIILKGSKFLFRIEVCMGGKKLIGLDPGLICFGPGQSTYHAGSNSKATWSVFRITSEVISLSFLLTHFINIYFFRILFIIIFDRISLI